MSNWFGSVLRIRKTASPIFFLPSSSLYIFAFLLLLSDVFVSQKLSAVSFAVAPNSSNFLGRCEQCELRSSLYFLSSLVSYA